MPTRHAITTAIKLVLYYLIYQYGFNTVAMSMSYLDIPIDTITLISLGMIASTTIMAWHLIHFGYVNLARDRYKEVSLPVLSVAFIFIFSGMYVFNLLIEQLGIPNTMEETFIAMSRNPVGLLSIALLAPILEELLFRGAIQSMLQEALGKPWLAILVASLIFGIVHGNPAQILFAFLLGMMFGWLYYRTGSVLPGIAGHMLNNSIAAFNMILYGNATIEEQMPDPITMWTWAAVATALCVLSAIWLNSKLNERTT